MIQHIYNLFFIPVGITSQGAEIDRIRLKPLKMLPKRRLTSTELSRDSALLTNTILMFQVKSDSTAKTLFLQFGVQAAVL